MSGPIEGAAPAAGANPTPPAPAPAQPAGPAPPGLASRLFDLPTASILVARYVDLKLGDPGGLFFLLVQAPLIGWFVSVAFDGKTEDRILDFVLALVAVWFGCFNACREVVKERRIFLRERRAGVSVRAYLASKGIVLALVAAAQCLVLQALVARTVTFQGSPPMIYLTLVGAALAATALGLFLSSVVASQNSLIALVPLALIPQLIFSKAVIPNAGELAERVQGAMLAAWALEALDELRRSAPAWGTVAQAWLALAAFCVGLLLLSVVALRAAHED